ncbi:hypothetical protein BDF20DRAFT_847701 [Mycotypha africana]|uniref:uncharacterized protein n=1 Tax=Mycotypha africana TaxID=64632 RepID=UPI002300A5BE|nr:uncharacterized protein BDF20DRAFT_847701 [Mycotypha africana]KAI8992002.1 hypothetical protein BDF20DRAFT_847701 [Mycotypha africana]
MATTIQHSNPVLLQQQRQQQTTKDQEDEDIVLASYLSNSLRFDQTQDIWQQQQQQLQQLQQQQAFYNTGNFYYYPQPAYPVKQTLPAQQQHQRSNRVRQRVSSNNTVSSNTSLNHHLPSKHQSPKKSSSTSALPKTSNLSSTSASSSPTTSFISTTTARPKMKQAPSSSGSSTTSASQSVNSNRRRSITTMNTLQQQLQRDRRPSISESIISSSAASITSEMSTSSKLSLSKKLRKVFSMNNMKSTIASHDLNTLKKRNGSNSSVVSSIASVARSSTSSIETTSSTKSSFRRRSIASLSALFSRNSIASTSTTSSTTMSTVSEVAEDNSTSSATSNINKKNTTATRKHSTGDLRHLVKKDKKKTLHGDTVSSGNTQLRVDTTARKGVLKVRTSSSTSSVAPESPNSAISTRSSISTRHATATNTARTFIQLPDPGLPSPTPSTSSSSKVDNHHNNEDSTNAITKPNVGFHYGFGLHNSSPRLRPTANSSTSSLAIVQTPINEEEQKRLIRKIRFDPTITVHETFHASEYDRRCDNNATCQKLTPALALKLKQELNEYKLMEMEVHVESRQYTQFFL